ncbi:hypothetical protein P280DRAFT_441284 [Massarina eburnea CBS 473.64]|uniref:Putative gamma-glutamylcyclotransferase n=1 Tax=Massarina eburnea CBS 473.64 TaxID=1395130 RepID=A0A6A6SKE9_9PLEO|nr:hypothetical protein P280DRAFT_441284 [Massarina eburnea CBS 473.64]
MATDSHTAFFYGTLMAPPVLHRVIWGTTSAPTPVHASSLTIRPAILPAHQRHKVRGADYPAVLPCAAGAPATGSSPDASPPSVRGTLVQGLTSGDMWRLDIFEGSDYTRRKVRVRVVESAHPETSPSPQDGNPSTEEIEAETYIWTASPSALEASEWDFSEFVREKMGRWTGEEVLDEGMKEVDGMRGEGEEDPTGGRGANGRITQRLEKEGR